MIQNREKQEEIIIENSKMMILFGCERSSMEDKCRSTILVQIESNTNIEFGKWEEFLKKAKSGKNKCKII